MTRHDENQGPRRPGGHAGERRRQFEDERGLPEPGELPLDEEAPGGEADGPERPQKEERSGGESD